MTNNRTNALERDTLAATQRATEGTSPAAENARNQESATALAVTLSDIEVKRGAMTVQDLIRHALTHGLSLSEVISGVDRPLR